MADDQLTKLEGRLRAIEAILLEMPEITTATVKAAKLRLRQLATGQPGSTQAAAASLRQSLGEPLDKVAEAALDEFLQRLVERRSTAT